MGYYRKLSGDKVFLSPIDPNDYEIYTKWVNDLSTLVPLGMATRNFGLSNEKEALEGLAKDGHNFAICLKEGDRLIGNASLFSINHVNRTAEIGLFIGDNEERNKGYGTEVLKVLLSYGFKILNLNNIMLKVFSFNKQGIKAYENAGFKEFGRRRESYYINDVYFDDVYMEVLKSEFVCEFLNEELPKKIEKDDEHV